MKNIIVIASIFALSFATGFTCSKNAPEQAAQPTEAAPAAPADQGQMAAAPTAEAAPASADGTAAQPAAPTETK